MQNIYLISTSAYPSMVRALEINVDPIGNDAAAQLGGGSPPNI